MSGTHMASKVSPGCRRLLVLALLLAVAGAVIAVLATPPAAKAAGTFTLQATPDSTAPGAVDLDWSSYGSVPNDVVFKGYQRKGESGTWQSISLMDYTKVTQVRVLNVYPDIDGSDKLESWMETGGASGYGRGILQVDKVPMTTFNNSGGSQLGYSGHWNYDVVVFGFWDRNNCFDLSLAACNKVDAFIAQGGGCVFGHDVALNNASQNTDTHETAGGAAKQGQVNFDYLAGKYFGGHMSYAGGGSGALTTVTVAQKGLLTQYPWNLGEVGTQFTIPATHTWGQSLNATGQQGVWLTLGDSPSVTANNFYIVTYNNVGMIMTGHTSGSATDDEQKLLANLIFYCYQLTSETSVKDRSAIDEEAPTVSPAATLQDGADALVDFGGQDQGTTYYYYVESYNKNALTVVEKTAGTASNPGASATVATGIKRYYYYIDGSSANANFDTGGAGVSTTASGSINVPYATYHGQYLHVRAEDNAGHLGDAETVQIPTPTYTIRFNANASDATGTTADKEMTYGVSDTLTPNGYARTHYTFDHWTTSPDGTGTQYGDGQSVSNLTASHGATVDLYATWDRDYGWLDVTKASSLTGITDGNGAYSLANATFGVYTDPDCTDQVATFTTDSSGATTVSVPSGANVGGYAVIADGTMLKMPTETYYVKETDVPKSYCINTNAYAATVTKGDTNTKSIQDVPGMVVATGATDAIWLAQKRDAQGIHPQGGATLADGQFTLRYYDNTEGTTTGDPERTWVLKSDESGGVKVDDSYKVSGDDLYTNRDDQPVLPVGTYTLTETQAPAGYRISDSTAHAFSVSMAPDNTGALITDAWVTATDAAFDDRGIVDEVIRGGMQIRKADHDSNASTTQGDAGTGTLGSRSFQGTKYVIKNTTGRTIHIASEHNPIVTGQTDYANGADCMEITAGANGLATIASNVLPYGTYEIRETQAASGYRLNSSWRRTFTVSTNGETVDLTGENDRLTDEVMRGGVSVSKVDYDTKGTTTQGDAHETFQGTTYGIYNKSANYVYVDNQRYDASSSDSLVLVKTIEADENGVASTSDDCLPIGRYLIKEIQPVDGYLNRDPRDEQRQPWHREFSIAGDGQMVEYDADSVDRNEDSVIRGGVNVKKADADGHGIYPQGNAGTGEEGAKTFAGTRYKVCNKSGHAVYIPDDYAYVAGTNLYAPEAICAFIVTGDDGIARLPGDALPYGTYEITEEAAVDGYLVNEGWAQTIEIRGEGDIIDLIDEGKRLEDAVQRGGVQVEKVDHDRKDNVTQGGAHETFEGTEYGIYNLSERHVYVDEHRYEKTTDPENPVLVKTITADADGVAKTDDDCLPYGTYLIKETKPVEGYLNSGWSRTFTISDNGQMRKYEADVAADRNEDSVIRGGVSISKVDLNSGSDTPQGDAGKLTDDGTKHTFAGTTYRIMNKSDHGVYIKSDDNPFAPDKSLYGKDEICIEIVADEDGIASTGDHALPYGTYLVQEVTPAVGYESSGWEAEFEILSNGQMVCFDDEEADSETRQNYEPVQRGGVSVAKVDADWLTSDTQGDASGTFAGTQYQITNASASYVCVDGHTYGVGDVVKTIIADEDGVATTGDHLLPYGTYTIRETAPVTEYLLNEAWVRTFTIRGNGQMQYYRKGFENERVEDQVIRGGLEIHKYDAETKQSVPQGGAQSFAGTRYVVRNLSPHSVHIKGDGNLYTQGKHDYANGESCAVLESDANGVAVLDNDVLPYGTYEVTETDPPAGYLNSGWTKTFSVRENGEPVIFDSTTGDLQRNEDPVAKGSVTVSKVDAETGQGVPQGNASLAGAEYSIVNASGHSVIVGGQKYDPGATCLVITSGADGMATSGTKVLPYGSYAISETKAPSGYANSGWIQSFTIGYDGNEVTFVSADDKNYESVNRLKTNVQIRKQDASYNDDGTSGAASLAGAVFAVRNVSANPVRVGGTLHPVDGVVMRLTTDTDGYASIATGTLPVGSYEVTEETPPSGYLHDSTWVGTIEVDAEGSPSVTQLSCPDPVIRGDVKFRKIEEGTQIGLPGIAFKITSVTTGESHIAVTDQNGMLDTSSAAASRENGTANANDAAVTHDDVEDMWTVDEEAIGANGIWFNGRKPGSVTPSNAVGALPYDTYEIEELRCASNRDHKLVPPFRITVSTEGYALSSETVPDPRREPPTVQGEHGDRVTLYKDSDPDPNSLVTPGTPITYTLRARNTGAEAQRRTLIRDYIPEGTEYVPDSASDGGAYVANEGGRPYVEWRMDDLSPRSEKAVTFQVRMLYDAPQYIQSTAYMTEVPADLAPGDPSNPTPTKGSNTVFHRTGFASTPAFVRVTKSSAPVSGKQVAWNAEIRYTLTVENVGGTAASMIGVYDKVPHGTELVSHTQENGGTVSGMTGHHGVGWLIPTLGAAQTVTLEMVVRVSDRGAVQSGGVVQSQASWGDQSNLASPGPPSGDLSNTTNIVEHPLYEAPSQTSDMHKDSLPKPEAVVSEGQQIHYTLTTTNSLSRAKPYELVRDYIPEHTKYVAGSASDGGAYVDATAAGNATGRSYVEWVLADIAPRESRHVTFDVTVSEDWESYIRNVAYTQTYETALVAGDARNPEPTARSNEMKHRTPVSEDPEDKFPLVRVTGSSDPLPGSTVTPGQEITYHLDVTNEGQATAYDVMVFNAVPDGTKAVSRSSLHAEDASDAAPSRSAGAGWRIERLGIGESARLSLTVKVDGTSEPTVIRSQAKWSYGNVAGAEASAPVDDTGMEDATNAIEHRVAPIPQAQQGSRVTCYADSAPRPNSVIKAGDQIEYVISATNTGKDPQEGTLVRDYVPDGTGYVQGSATEGGTYVPAGDSADGRAYVEWVIRDIAPREIKRVSLKVTVADGHLGAIPNVAGFSECDGGTRPGDPGNPSPTWHTNAVWHSTEGSQPTPAVVQVTKESEPEPGSHVARGETVRYVLRVTNTGQSPSGAQGVYDAVPEGLVAIDGSVSGDFSRTLSADGSHVAWLIPGIDPGQSIELAYEARIADATTWELPATENQASWGESDELPDAPLDNTSNIVQHALSWSPGPSVTKEVVGGGRLTVGDEVTFSIKVRNDGEAPMLGWTLTDEPPAELSFVSDDSKAVLREDGTLLWQVDLRPGEEKAVTLRMRATKATAWGASRNVAVLRDPSGTEAGRSSADVTIATPAQASPLLQTGGDVGGICSVIGAVTGGLLSYDLVRRKRTLS